MDINNKKNIKNTLRNKIKNNSKTINKNTKNSSIISNSKKINTNKKQNTKDGENFNTSKQKIETKLESVKITKIPRKEQIEYIRLKRRKLNKKNLVLLIILFLSFIFLVISLFNTLSWISDNKNIDKQVDEIKTITKVEIIENNDNTEIIENKNIKKSDPYWDYIKMDMINVDFKKLKTINSDTKGWLQVNGTNVNYPFVQTNNNDYYLNHAFDKSKNGGGWVFLDYRNNLSNNEKNTIIYGHGRQNKTIFGSLKNILETNWINNSDNFVIKLSTEYENTLWQIFSVYRIPTTNDYIQTKFKDNSEFYSFATTLLNRSQYNFNTTINENDQILTLSTCYNDDDKFVIHAKLIKRKTR